MRWEGVRDQPALSLQALTHLRKALPQPPRLTLTSMSEGPPLPALWLHIHALNWKPSWSQISGLFNCRLYWRLKFTPTLKLVNLCELEWNPYCFPSYCLGIKSSLPMNWLSPKCPLTAGTRWASCCLCGPDCPLVRGAQPDRGPSPLSQALSSPPPSPYSLVYLGRLTIPGLKASVTPSHGLDWVCRDPQPRPLATSEPWWAFIPDTALGRVCHLLCSPPNLFRAIPWKLELLLPHLLGSISGPRRYIEHCIWKQEMWVQILASHVVLDDLRKHTHTHTPQGLSSVLTRPDWTERGLETSYRECQTS